MWERWDGWTPAKGFQDPGMNSFNHYWLGCVSEWLITQAAGIDTDGPAFNHIRIRPEIVKPGTGFDWVKAHYDSIHGRIESNWRRQAGHFELAVTIPANTTATVYLPAAKAETITESGQPLAKVSGVNLLRVENGIAVIAIGSGNYQFMSDF